MCISQRSTHQKPVRNADAISPCRLPQEHQSAPCYPALVRAAYYLICIALWSIGRAIFGIVSNFLPVLREGMLPGRVEQGANRCQAVDLGASRNSPVFMPCQVSRSMPAGHAKGPVDRSCRGPSDSVAEPAFDRLIAEIRACTFCAPDLPFGPHPVLRGRPSARLLIISQAPGTRVHETGLSFNDRSGDRLRAWLALDRETFYDETRIAIAPIGFCYPGRDGKGGDLPPRRDVHRYGTRDCSRSFRPSNSPCSSAAARSATTSPAPEQDQ
jgi:Uracil DNA glycosylase superfamily